MDTSDKDDEVNIQTRKTKEIVKVMETEEHSYNRM